MVKAKRKSKTKQARKAVKKAKAIKVLKKKARPAPKARARARKPLKRKLVRHVPKKAPKAATPAKASGKAPAAARTDDKAKKPTIKSARAALEQLEAKLAEGLKSKAARGRPGRKSKREEWLAAMAVLPKEDAETRRTRLKTLIKLGKDRGFLTYAEINDHLPDDLVDAEQIEAIISTFGDMGIQVYDQAPDQEQLLITAESAQVAPTDEDVEEQAEAALSTVDSEFGRTTDPVRMYMREMGSVELLTREGE
ncbi:MAG: RNA polymerase sigma factor region1.1 domain-containing protein, partial [Burkholderiales bacterium]